MDSNKSHIIIKDISNNSEEHKSYIIILKIDQDIDSKSELKCLEVLEKYFKEYFGEAHLRKEEGTYFFNVINLYKENNQQINYPRFKELFEKKCIENQIGIFLLPTKMDFLES